jgi:Tol biopolymer transport system component
MIVPLDGRLGLKQRNSADITPIPGTEGARNPTYSPDAQWIAYAVANAIYKRPLSGGAPVRVADGAEVGGLRVGLSWLDDGTILYERQSPLPYVLAQVDEDGGDPLREIGGLGGLAWVYGLPGSNGALVVRLNNELHVADLRTGTSRLILEGVRRAWYAPTGHLVYVQSDGTVMAVPFDLDTLEPTGIGRPLFDGVRTTSAATDIHLASDGTLLFAEGGASAGMAAFQLSLLYLDGRVEALPVPPGVTTFSWSPDGASVAFSSQGQIFTYDVDRNTLPRQVTLEGANNRPFYSPDGTRLVFSSTRDGSEGADLFVKDLTNDSPERSLLKAAGGQFPTQWATETLIFFNERSGGFDVWTLDLSNPEQPEPRPYVDSPAIEIGVGLWPGGAFALYVLVNADGGIDGYLRTFPGDGAPSLVARDLTGGPSGVSPDGRTLYYTTVTGEVVAARVVLEPVPAVLSVDTLFAVPPGILTGTEVDSPLHPDGDRFLTAIVGSPGTEASASGRMILVTNWFEELKERMAVP